ncbi:hypothetical protein TI04_05145 [Achromatium sp. WMS2]|nr:hypothetical protein TI04_05145 [Achromatium sp. WMS2]
MLNKKKCRYTHYSLALAWIITVPNSGLAEPPVAPQANTGAVVTTPPPAVTTDNKSATTVADPNAPNVQPPEPAVTDHDHAQYAQRMAANAERREQAQAQARAHWEARLADLNTRYQELRRRAAANGVQLSDSPPWNAAPEANPGPVFSYPLSGDNNAPPVAPEYPNNGHDPMTQPPPSGLPPQVNLEHMQEVINGMSPEEREVCTTVHRLSMGFMQHQMPPPPPPPAYDQGGNAPYPQNAAPDYGQGNPGPYYNNFGRMQDPRYAPNNYGQYNYPPPPPPNPGYAPNPRYQAPHWRNGW